MAYIVDILRSLNPYPAPIPTLVRIAMRHGLDADADIDASVMRTKAFNLAKADYYEWLSLAPNVSQGGQTYSFNEDQRDRLAQMARNLRDAYDDDDDGNKPIYGYKGSRL